VNCFPPPNETSAHCALASRKRQLACPKAFLRGVRSSLRSVAGGDRLDILGGLFSAHVAFADHPVGTRIKGEYPVVTVRSILRWLGEGELVSTEREWRLAQESERLGLG
jgi:hypothetical protein